MWCLNGIANRDGRVNNLKINRFIDFIKIYYKLIKSALVKKLKVKFGFQKYNLQFLSNFKQVEI